MLTDEIAEGLLRTMITCGKKAYEDQTDYDAMSEIMWCGSISHKQSDRSWTAKGFPLPQAWDMRSAVCLMWLTVQPCPLSGEAGQGMCYRIDPARFARYGEKVWGIVRMMRRSGCGGY